MSAVMTMADTGWQLLPIGGSDTDAGRIDDDFGPLLEHADGYARVYVDGRAMNGVGTAEDARRPVLLQLSRRAGGGAIAGWGSDGNADADIDADAAIDAPVPPLTIDVAAHTRCVLIETHDADPRRECGEALQALRIDVNLATGATLQHLRVVTPALQARIDHLIRARLDAGAHYDQLLIASGSRQHTQRSEFKLADASACARTAAVLFATDSALEQQVRVEHAAAGTRSAVEALVLASGKARATAAAHTCIDTGATDAQARQRLTGIPTGGQPRLALRPHLEINHDQVQASHGATWGALPQDALFYAQQRGLDEQTARRLIIGGMALAVLERGVQPPDAPPGSDDQSLLRTLGIAARLSRAAARHLATNWERVDD